MSGGLIAAFVFLFSGSAGPGHSPLGTNLTEMRDWSTEWSLVDTFKQSREWFSGTASDWEDRRPLDLDENGWVKSLKPGQSARTLMFWAKGMPYPAGEYVVLYEGEGKLHYTPNVKLVSTAPGREVIRPDPQQSGFGVGINETNPKNYVRNIRVLMPGGVCSNDAFKWCKGNEDCGGKNTCNPFEKVYQEQIFHPVFLDKIRNYSTLRFKDWMNTDYDSHQEGWETRPKLTDARWTAKGVPVEIMVELANRLKAEPWFSMYHKATDQYVTEFAVYVRDHLDKARRAYIEHSNEVWNNQYDQARYARAKAIELRLSHDEREGQARWNAKRSVEIFKIWEKVFGGKERIVRVIGSWSENPLVSDVQLAYDDAAKHADALAVAPYFGVRFREPADLARVEAMTLDAVLAETKNDLTRVAHDLQEQARIAKKHHVELIAYEGGQHLVGVGPARENPRINMLFDQANRDPRMKSIYLEYLKIWKEAGGHLFVHYTNCSGPSKYGRFGSLEMLDQIRSAAPKYDALQEFIEKNPRWW